MDQNSPLPTALIVEDDPWQRQLMMVLLEENEMGVVECDSAEGALLILDEMGERVSLMFTDVNLAGEIDGVELAHFASQHYPKIHVIVTSGRALPRNLPDGAVFMHKPWRADDVQREVERSQH